MSSTDAGHPVSGPQTERDVYEALMRPCIGPLHRTAWRMTGDKGAAEDLVQEVCLSAYRGFGGYKQGTNFSAWVFRILTNAYIDGRRKKDKSPFVDMDDETMEIATHSSETYGSKEPDGPEAELINKGFRTDVMQAVAALKPEIRIVVSLALLEELTYQEIAAIVDCPIGTVRSRLSRGRQALQAQLTHYMPARYEECHHFVSATASRSGRG